VTAYSARSSTPNPNIAYMKVVCRLGIRTWESTSDVATALTPPAAKTKPRLLASPPMSFLIRCGSSTT
jgi:hypothetical protein